MAPLAPTIPAADGDVTLTQLRSGAAESRSGVDSAGLLLTRTFSPEASFWTAIAGGAANHRARAINAMTPACTPTISISATTTVVEYPSRWTICTGGATSAGLLSTRGRGAGLASRTTGGRFTAAGVGAAAGLIGSAGRIGGATGSG